MSFRGRAVAACCPLVTLFAIGAATSPAIADADHSPEAATQTTREVVVLSVTDDGGAPTDLATSATAETVSSGEILTPELDVPEFFVAGLTWDGIEAPEQQIFIRVQTDGEWTPWSELAPEAAEHQDVAGTEAYIVGGATGVQLRVVTGGDEFPDNLGLHLIPTEPGENQLRASTEIEVAELADQVNPAGGEQPSVSATAIPTQATPSGSSVVERSGWRADESKMRWRPENKPLRAAVVHHTAGTNNYTAAQSASIVRGIYHYHAVTRGWGDIGYNFLVDKYGQIFEGRTGSLAAPGGSMPVAAHARGFNTGTLGISVLGDYSSVRAPDSVLATMADVIAWKFDAADIDMSTPSGMISPGTNARPAGQNLPRIYAHRDVGATTCPGNNIYARIPALNRQVADRMEDLVDGDVYHLRNDHSGGAAHLVFRLGLPTDEVLVGDWNGDGRDTLALRRGNTYHVYNAHPGRSFKRINYGRVDDVILVGDWNGDGQDTFAVRRGDTYHVKNSMASGDADVIIRYGRAGDEILVGDWNGNGQDTFTVRRGAQYHVKNRIAGGNADRVFNYGRAGDEVIAGDWNGNGQDTFAVRRGAAYHLRNSLTGGDAHIVLTYGRSDDFVIVGDWNGDGRDTFGIRRSP